MIPLRHHILLIKYGKSDRSTKQQMSHKGGLSFGWGRLAIKDMKAAFNA